MGNAAAITTDIFALQKARQIKVFAHYRRAAYRYWYAQFLPVHRLISRPWYSRRRSGKLGMGCKTAQ